MNPVKDSNGLYQGGTGKGVTEWSWDTWSSHNGGYPIIPTSVGIELGDSVGVSDYAVKARTVVPSTKRTSLVSSA